MTAAGIMGIISLVMEGIALGRNVIEAWNEGSKAIEKFQTEGRDPTPAEISQLRSEIAALGAQIDAVDLT